MGEIGGSSFESPKALNFHAVKLSWLTVAACTTAGDKLRLWKNVWSNIPFSASLEMYPHYHLADITDQEKLRWKD